MVEIYSVCGKWNLDDKSQWKFLVDANKGGSLCEVDENITYKDLVEMVIEDFGFDRSRDITLSFELPMRTKSILGDFPPMNMRNDRQVRAFINKIKEDHELIRLCVTVSNKCNFIEDVGENVGNNIQANTIHNEGNYDVVT
ncbi:unnamed protein product [Thlaspi arvense]|uniref:Uncharacterized protein n=1 Tax=Thlaspi arvense TaxID=13288 RepID=A0AAU9R5P3_THLAR|nr:unnamed protein product [Thlaspi arvense]